MFVSSPSALRGATLIDGRVVDIMIVDDIVVSVVPASASPVREGELDAHGYLVLTAPADPHTHLDKALSWSLIRPPSGDLETAIASWLDYVATVDSEEIYGRAVRAIEEYVANGVTALRTHVDVPHTGDPLRGVNAIVRAREEFADIADIEIVALPGRETTRDRLEAALDAGADLVGGAPHLAEDETADVHRLIDVAEARGIGIDIHADEALYRGTTLRTLAERTLRWSATRTAGHCVRLSTLPDHELLPLMSNIAAAGIGVVANPITNLYLQGWESDVATPRGIAPVNRLRAAGVLTAAGGDNVRDPFNPMGRADALETAMLLVTACHVPIDDAWAAVSTDARRVMGLPAAGTEVGMRADLIGIRAASLADALATAPADRFVISRGRLVARTRTTRWTAPRAIKEVAL
ncbi:amidohydrolase family protein [Microbacterium amylolyticum]|uniref:Cytosine deaminase n=1 Tax=Microbacterium amylolyticum TaxID=936337 RepID=A0ABS4ZJ30_9MICO|nr:amidohydrolase family protein [Microbacterium amylolyticum]MBP2437284.1 cytosine deaminase [Microbacterium amylolyticum]